MTAKPERVDVLVIGVGASGAAFSWSLSQAGSNVMCLDQGGLDRSHILTYSGYYSNPAVIRLLGLEARPPQPRDYVLEPLDISLLEPVKQRQLIYREV